MKKKVLIGSIILVGLIIIFSLIVYLYPQVESREEIAMNFLKTYLRSDFHPKKIYLVNEKPPYEKNGFFYGMSWNITPNENFYLYLSYNSDNKTLSHIFIVVYPNYHKINASLEDYFLVPSEINWNCSLPSTLKLPEGFTDCRASWFDDDARIDAEILSYTNGNTIMLNLFKMFPQSEVFNLKFGRLIE